MASDGLSLIGFVQDPAVALQYLKNTCIPSTQDDASILATWVSARARLGSPVVNAGRPEILDLDPHYNDHLARLRAPGQIANWLNANPHTEFKVVEIDPLLAFQISINKERSAHHCSSLTSPPEPDSLVTLALPENHDTNGIQIDNRPQSVIIKTRNLNLQVFQSGLANNVAGMLIGFSLSLVHVVRLNGRCYLHNGFHRAFGARLAGATHIPCLFRDVETAEGAGIKADGSTFALETLESDNPPTLAHYTEGRALSVRLRSMSRILHVSWAEYLLPDE